MVWQMLFDNSRAENHTFALTKVSLNVQKNLCVGLFWKSDAREVTTDNYFEWLSTMRKMPVEAWMNEIEQ